MTGGRQTRATIGLLAWCTKEARPDAAAGASILASGEGHLREHGDPRGQEQAKSPTPLEKLRFGVATDASFDNHTDGSSQGAVGVLAYDVDLCSALELRPAGLPQQHQAQGRPCFAER